MQSTTSRIIIVVLSLLIGAILFLQVYWLRKTYAYEQQAFSTAVVKSIRGVYEDLDMVAEPGNRMHQLVTQPDLNTFVFRIDSVPHPDTLRHSLVSEFDDFRVYTDCKVTVFHKGSRQVQHLYLPAAGSLQQVEDITGPQVSPQPYSFVQLHFPHRNRYLLVQMEGWILTSALVVLLLIGLAGTIYFFFREKNLTEVQRDFINNVTHEFSTPLTIIELSTDGLSKEGIAQKPERMQRYVQAIRYQSEYLKKHIQTLVKTVVTERPHFVLEKTIVAPNELLRRAVAQLETITLEKGGTIEMDLEPTDAVLEADAENLFLALINLLTNALKYSEHPVVKVHTVKGPLYYLIQVKDNGIGIAPENLKRIFKKFYRVQQGNVQGVRGLGLGLYFTHKIITLHGGTIRVQSTVGVGTTFEVLLPVKN